MYGFYNILPLLVLMVPTVFKEYYEQLHDQHNDYLVLRENEFREYI